MSWDNRVAWTEGLFLCPEHLQQADRHNEKFARQIMASRHGYGWGFTQLTLNTEMLAQGRIGIIGAAGILDDGTPFSIPDDADAPPPYAPPRHLRDERIHLCLPLRQPGMSEVEHHPAPDLPARFAIAEKALVDTVSGEKDPARIEVMRLRFRILPESADRAGFTSIPVARVVEVRNDGQILLDADHVPPVLDCAAARPLADHIAEVAGLLHHRGEALSGRLTESGSRGVAEMSDFLLLQLINRTEPLFRHLGQTPRLHPEAAFATLLQLAGELGTFSRANKRFAEMPAYDHDDLAGCFRPLIVLIRAALNAVLAPTALRIPLRQFKYGVHMAEVADRGLFTAASFVLVVRAATPPERLRRDFPAQVKVGPAERIRELVNVALPGVGLEPLALTPREIPFAPQTVCFQLDQNSAYWKDMRGSGGLALHVPGDFPDLDMALWAIPRAEGGA
ncbi:type VI secretion system baseplate subunit TssK [Falsirhodobacter sp. 1013]|uniref:type VI secretion system baseplate subunit TssK n=1 Tax=Falsirhodobacter sp. 1013 TaxID=3417566 RepID=UPI003EBA2C93